MKEYVVGFAYWREHVLLIHKERGPAYVIGKLNGVGGKVEGNESPTEAMAREFEEETGIVSVPHYTWLHNCTMNGPDYILHVLSVNLPNEFDYYDVKNPEENAEKLVWCQLTEESFRIGCYDAEKEETVKLVENLQWLIPLTIDPTAPFLEINEA